MFFERKCVAVLTSLVLGFLTLGFGVYGLSFFQRNDNAQTATDSIFPLVTGGSYLPINFGSELSGQEPTLGDNNASLIMFEFADFQCPFCKRFFKESLPTIKKKYIDTGKIKLVFINFPFLGQESENAAQAVKCAGDQGQFWAYHDLLFNRQNGENLGNFTLKKLHNLAQSLSLNLANFDQCISGLKYQDIVEKELQLAQKYGVKATPTFFVKDKIIKGARPLKEFEDILDMVLRTP